MSNPDTLIPFKKGEDERRTSRAGKPNLMTRAMKKALINAAETSIHSKDRGESLEGYCRYIADVHPTTFAMMLTRLIPVQAKIKTSGNVRVEQLNINMPLSDMISKFEMKIKSGYQAPKPVLVIDNEAEADDEGDDA